MRRIFLLRKALDYVFCSKEDRKARYRKAFSKAAQKGSNTPIDKKH